MKTKILTWRDLANIYDKQTGGHARTMEQSTILKWAERQPKKFVFDKDGALCLICE